MLTSCVSAFACLGSGHHFLQPQGSTELLSQTTFHLKQLRRDRKMGWSGLCKVTYDPVSHLPTACVCKLFLHSLCLEERFGSACLHCQCLGKCIYPALPSPCSSYPSPQEKGFPAWGMRGTGSRKEIWHFSLVWFSLSSLILTWC